MATRIWVSEGGTLGVATHDRMRWRCFAKQLQTMNVEFDPPLQPRRPMSRDGMVTPKTRACVHCGTMFFSFVKTQACSPACGQAHGRERPKHVGAIRRNVAIDQIMIPDGHRPIDPQAVKGITESIRRLGMHMPIAVYDCDDGLFLVAGRHRMQAHIALGRDQIDAYVFTDERQAMLWSVSENLHRAELSALERSDAFERWRQRTGRKGAQVAPLSTGRGHKGGIRDAARELHVTRRDAQRAAKIAGLSPEAKQAARETGQDDNQAALLRAAEHDNPDDQIAALRGTKPSKRHIDVREAFCRWIDHLDHDDLVTLADLDLLALVAERLSARVRSDVRNHD